MYKYINIQMVINALPFKLWTQNMWKWTLINCVNMRLSYKYQNYCWLYTAVSWWERVTINWSEWVVASSLSGCTLCLYVCVWWVGLSILWVQCLNISSYCIISVMLYSVCMGRPINTLSDWVVAFSLSSCLGGRVNIIIIIII